jgi:hypothetical protein
VCVCACVRALACVPDPTASKYYGSARRKPLSALRAFDVLLSTYSVVSNALLDDEGQLRAADTLRQINFYRIVLDEAHQIRNPETKVSCTPLFPPLVRCWRVGLLATCGGLFVASSSLLLLEGVGLLAPWWSRCGFDPIDNELSRILCVG